jgi:hypothetical protein
MVIHGPQKPRDMPRTISIWFGPRRDASVRDTHRHGTQGADLTTQPDIYVHIIYIWDHRLTWNLMVGCHYLREWMFLRYSECWTSWGFLIAVICPESLANAMFVSQFDLRWWSEHIRTESYHTCLNQLKSPSDRDTPITGAVYQLKWEQQSTCSSKHGPLLHQM